MTPVACQRCAKEFYVKPSHAVRRRFCGYFCKGKWQSEFQVPWNKGKNGVYSAETIEKIKAARARQIGESEPHWKGGRRIQSQGYIEIRIGRKYRLEHRIVAEKVLGRSLSRIEQVHHRNYKKTDNRPENLEILSIREHAKLHNQMRREKQTI